MNIILISIDSLRADHVGCYGYHRNTTPNIDKLAKQGTIFKNCYAQSSHTPTSHASLFTGLYPSEHKIYFVSDIINQNIITLPKILRHNYYCAAFVNFMHFFISLRFKKQHHYSYCDFNNNKLLYKIFKKLEKIQRPFYLFMHYGKVHVPYDPPKMFFKKFIKEQTNTDQMSFNFFLNKIEYFSFLKKIYYSNRMPLFIKKIIKKCRFFFIFLSTIKKDTHINQKIINYLIGKYDGEINYMDYKLGLLFKKLKQLNLLKKTYIIITSDHGDEFYEHKFLGHGRNLYNTLIKVPLIIIGPGIKKKIINKPVMHIDIFPTVLGLLNIKEDIKTSGENLFNIKNIKRPIISEFYPLVAIQKNNYKLITNLLDKKGFIEKIKYIIHEILKNPKKIKYIPFKLNKILKKEELYDLKNDPYEQKNIINERLEIRNQLKKELDEWYRNLRKANIKSKKIRYEKKAKEQLRKLGYI